jgi:PAS domain S-box-containing protein
MGTMAVTMLPVGAGVLARQRAERSARETEEGLRLAVEAGHMGTWEWAVDSGTVKWSPALEAIHGLAPGTFGGTFAAFRAEVHPEDLARVEKSIARSLQTGTHHLEYRIVRADGSVRWLEARGQVSYDEVGRPVRVQASAWTSPHQTRGGANDFSSRSARRCRAEDVEQRLSLVGEIARSIIAS